MKLPGDAALVEGDTVPRLRQSPNSLLADATVMAALADATVMAAQI